MINFMNDSNRLSTLGTFDDKTAQTLVFLSPNTLAPEAYLVFVDEGSLFKKYNRNGNKKTSTRQVETNHGNLDIDENFENLYLIKFEDRVMLVHSRLSTFSTLMARKSVSMKTQRFPARSIMG